MGHCKLRLQKKKKETSNWNSIFNMVADGSGHECKVSWSQRIKHLRVIVLKGLVSVSSVLCSIL